MRIGGANGLPAHSGLRELAAMLNDRNTIPMVAEHWNVSPRTVRRLVDKGDLPFLRIGGAIRLTRQAVESYEQQCTNSGNTQTASGTSSTATGRGSAYQRGKQTAQQQKSTSPNSSPAARSQA